MTLEEKLRAYAAKGELVHVSLAFTRDAFECVFTAASPAGGHSIGRSGDPVEACELALASAPIPLPRAKRPTRNEEEAATVDTVTVTAERALNSEWTTP